MDAGIIAGIIGAAGSVAAALIGLRAHRQRGVTPPPSALTSDVMVVVSETSRRHVFDSMKGGLRCVG